MNRQLIVQHTTKCGGSALLLSLKDAFGADNIYHDDSDRLNEPVSLFNVDPARYFREARKQRPLQDVIYGHFPISKYAHMKNAFRVGLMRHPTARLISHYLYVNALSDPDKYFYAKYIVDNALSVVDMARLPAFRSIYGKVFFRQARPEHFDLVVFQEHYDFGIARLAELVGRPIAARSARVTAQMKGASAEKRAQALSPETSGALDDILASDIDLFETIKAWPCAAWAA